MEQQITCINCPVGCRLQVVVENGEVKSVTATAATAALPTQNRNASRPSAW